MSLREKVRELLCPTCLPDERGHARRENTLTILERSSEALDRIAADLRTISERMADGRNPLIGDRHEKERP
jgi:uncharacterized membrane-anchored protein YhcB (DUF1043 family)